MQNLEFQELMMGALEADIELVERIQRLEASKNAE